MNDRNYKKKYELQNKIISRQSKELEEYKLQIENLKLELEKKGEIVGSIVPLRAELLRNIDEAKKYNKEYKELVGELRKMKKIFNQEVYNNKWSLVKFFIK